MAEVVRTAPDGARVSVTVPATAGTLKWYGTIRFNGPDFLRDFSFAEAGAHQVIPKKILPGARTEVFRRRGFDLVVYEAADRSDACLVIAGPHNEATTWFGGPAPRPAVLNRITSMVDFADSPTGARLTPRPGANLQQFGTMVIGSDARMTIMIKDARQVRDQLPTWRGLVQGEAEVWRSRMDVHETKAAKLAGTPFEWRYTYANPTAVFDVAFRDETPPGITLNVAVDEDYVNSMLSGLRVTWAG
ncbi:hypothetical protein [Micromonospora deserti]|uniref:Uncharacterized protein n=1 Tax=Micromonospora deserti TaxID=2070366 RepID=A0A2W2CVB3_9ACTN|nr:hypothetical protein [Micromonospora deserti]PZG02513.1 hypothetical protein C1I99_01995 [Micromonospora deserti]